MQSISTGQWILIGLIGWVLFKIFYKGGGAVKYCKTCGFEGKTESHTPGNILIEIILWLCFIIPGVIYSIWRVSSRSQKCAKCGSKEIVPLDSPVAVAARIPQINA